MTYSATVPKLQTSVFHNHVQFTCNAPQTSRNLYTYSVRTIAEPHLL